MKDKTVVRGFSLQEQDIAIIRRKADDLATTDSNALRLIVREWYKLVSVSMLPSPVDGATVPVLHIVPNPDLQSQ